MRFGRPKTGCFLLPVDDDARAFINDRKAGNVVELEVLYDRDMIEHRRIFAQIADLAKALHRDPERVRAELLYRTGNFQFLGELDGKALISINSMSRRHMQDHELHAFWDDARVVILVELLPLIADVAERDQLAAMLFPEGGPPAEVRESGDPVT